MDCTSQSRNSGPLRLGAMLAFALLLGRLPPAGLAADQSYVIKRGDTLHGIARKHGINLSDLVERNDLSKNAHIYAGRRLIIPSPRSSAQAVDLPRAVHDAIAKAPVQPGRWKHIVIHHSGVHTGSVKSMDRYHREERHMENGLAYHFVIGNGSGMRDGQVVAGRRWTKQLDGGHLASEAQNHSAIGICLVGDFDHRTPTAKQMRSLRALVKSLMKRCRLPLAAVKTHQEINVISTRCPGSKFNAKALRSSL